MKDKKLTKEQESLIKVLLGVPQNIELFGFYRGVPVLHDPEHPAPDGVMYFINDDNLRLNPNNYVN